MDAIYRGQLEREVAAVFARQPHAFDHRWSHPWLIGALGDPRSRIWFVGENPSLTMVERAKDPDGGPASVEAQWWASRGDKLFREMLAKHGFKDSPPEALGGWRCYITNTIKEADYVNNWRGSPSERRQHALEAWSPVLRWELEQSRPTLVVALGKTVRRNIDHLLARGVPFPEVITVQHYSYIALRPRGSLGPMHPLRLSEYDEDSRP